MEAISFSMMISVSMSVFVTRMGFGDEAKRIEMEANLDRVYCPIVSLDGQHLFFIGHRSDLGNVYWVDAKIIEELKPGELK